MVETVSQYKDKSGKVHSDYADAKLGDLEFDLREFCLLHFRGGDYSPRMLAQVMAEQRVALANIVADYRTRRGED